MEMRNADKLEIRKLQENKPLGKNVHRLEDNIKMDIKKNMAWKCTPDSSDLGKEPITGFWGHSTKTSGPIKAGNFMSGEQLLTFQDISCKTTGKKPHMQGSKQRQAMGDKGLEIKSSTWAKPGVEDLKAGGTLTVQIPGFVLPLQKPCKLPRY
jgi:hypothetical protein